MPRGGSSHDRRRQRRAAERNGAEGLHNALHSVPSAELDADGMTDAEIAAVIAAASGSTSLPLSDRDTPWDAGAAKRSLTDAQFGSAHFWRDSSKPADQITSYKLPFAKNDGGLTAIWRGVTAGAAAMSGSRGGVDIPEADRAGVRSRMASYYSKAAKKYDDPSIKPPWESTKEDAVEILKARGWEVDHPENIDDVVTAAVALAHAESLDGDPEFDFDERLDHWKQELSLTPERAALALVEAFADGEGDVGPSQKCDNCGHAAMAHEGADNMGACTVDGCNCDGMQPMEDGESSSATAAGTLTLGIRFPDVIIDRAADVLAAGAELVDVEERTADAVGQILERVTFRLENLRLEGAGIAAAAEAQLPDSAVAPTGLRWVADAVFEGVLTDDGRAFAPGALTWRQLPLTLGAMLDTPHADLVMESRAAGSITEIARVGNTLVARGVFDSGDFGQEVARMVSDGTLRGISIDVAVHASEVAPRLDFFDEDGNWREERIETSPEGSDLLDILFGPGDQSDPPIWVVTEGVIGAITVCPFPAFADARIEIAASLAAGAAGSPSIVTFTHQSRMTIIEEPGEHARGLAMLMGKRPVAEQLQAAITASAEGLAPLKPPTAWFEDPEFEQLTALVVTDEGRVYGHAAPWGTCHIAIPDVCTEAPHTESNYDFFHLKSVATEEGVSVPCGTITLGTGHAGRGLGVNDTTAHYDHTGTAVADVVVGEDAYGIWVAGALRPDIDAETARKLQGAVLSGDWRQVEFSDGTRNLELVALLAVNVPGFPIPRTRALVAAGEEGLEVVALVAAGVHIGTSEDEQLEKIKLLGLTDQFRALSERARA